MEEIKYLRLSELTSRIRQVINDAFALQKYWIVAEVSGHKFYPDGDRHYFDLVEKMENSSTETAKVKANSWEQGSRQIAHFEKTTGQNFKDGLQVLICVRINYHIIHGLSFTLLDIDPNFTLGNLERQRQETLARLIEENPDTIKLVGDQYVTRNKVIKLNSVIQRIALIGSPNSEGYTDFIHTIKSNHFGYRFTVDNFYSTVQGVNAEQELVKTLIQVFETNKQIPYDCVVITRGGGARTDFLVFDTYSLARVVARFPIPIITGIGHHKDVGIVDLMAHTQTKTPTKVAEFILAHNRSFEEKVLHHQQHIIIRTQQLMAGHTLKITKCYQRITHSTPALLTKMREQMVSLMETVRNRPARSLEQQNHYLFRLRQKVTNCSTEILNKNERMLDRVFHKLVTKPKELVLHRNNDLVSVLQFIRIYSQTFILQQKKFLEHQHTLMKMMSPGNILKKGFAIVSRNEKIITRADELNAGDSITITLHDTDINSTITSKKETHGKYDV